MIRFYKKILTKLKTYQYRHLNVRLIIFITALSILGFNVVSSAIDNDPSYVQKQLIGIVGGSLVMLIVMFIDYRFVLKFAWLIYIFNVFMLLAVRFLGEEHKGAARWIKVAGIQIQPSELSKILLFTIITFAVPLLLIYKQPDLSTSVAIVLVFAAMIYIAGLSYKIIFSVLALMIPTAIVLVYLIMQPDQKILEEYQYNRLVGFYDEDNEQAQRISYQQDNAVLAIGSGGLWGKGLGNDSPNSVKNGNLIPEPQTDFIFAVVGEELGFAGTASIILLALVTFECVYVGAHAADMAGKIICSGMAMIIAVQTFINIAVVTKMMPNTGLTLPFVSYGLSSLLSLYLGMGFVLNVGLQRRKLQ